MGDILIDFNAVKIPGRPSVYIERKVDEIETQKLQFIHDRDSWLSTETGDSIRLFGRDSNGNTIEVEMPISVRDLKEALEEWTQRKYMVSYK